MFKAYGDGQESCYVNTLSLCINWVILNAESLQMLLLKFYSIYIYASELQLITKEIESVLTLQKNNKRKKSWMWIQTMNPLSTSQITNQYLNSLVSNRKLDVAEKFARKCRIVMILKERRIPFSICKHPD